MAALLSIAELRLLEQKLVPHVCSALSAVGHSRRSLHSALFPDSLLFGRTLLSQYYDGFGLHIRASACLLSSEMLCRLFADGH